MSLCKAGCHIATFFHRTVIVSTYHPKETTAVGQDSLAVDSGMEYHELLAKFNILRPLSKVLTFE